MAVVRLAGGAIGRRPFVTVVTGLGILLVSAGNPPPTIGGSLLGVIATGVRKRRIIKCALLFIGYLFLCLLASMSQYYYLRD